MMPFPPSFLFGLLFDEVSLPSSSKTLLPDAANCCVVFCPRFLPPCVSSSPFSEPLVVCWYYLGDLVAFYRSSGFFSGKGLGGFFLTLPKSLVGTNIFHQPPSRLSLVNSLLNFPPPLPVGIHSLIKKLFFFFTLMTSLQSSLLRRRLRISFPLPRVSSPL